MFMIHSNFIHKIRDLCEKSSCGAAKYKKVNVAGPSKTITAKRSLKVAERFAIIFHFHCMLQLHKVSAFKLL